MFRCFNNVRFVFTDRIFLVNITFQVALYLTRNRAGLYSSEYVERKECTYFTPLNDIVMEQDFCAGGFIKKNKKWLFGKRAKNKSWAPGLWDIVGGRSKIKETPFDTLKREIFEETNLLVIKAELLAVWKVKEKKGIYFKYYIYLVTDYTGKKKNTSKEHSKLRWLGKAKLQRKNLALDKYRRLLDKCS